MLAGMGVGEGGGVGVGAIVAVGWLAARVGTSVGVLEETRVGETSVLAGVGNGLTGSITPRRYVRAVSTRQLSLALKDGTWNRITMTAASPRRHRITTTHMLLPRFLDIGAILPSDNKPARLENSAL